MKSGREYELDAPASLKIWHTAIPLLMSCAIGCGPATSARAAAIEAAGGASGALNNPDGSSGAGASAGTGDSAGAQAGAATGNPSVFSITPKSVNVSAGSKQTFNCGPGTCTFSIKEAGGGSISSAGIYTAPSAAGVYHIVATSSADASKSDVATVNVAQSLVAACDALPSAGTWENVTPPEVLAGFDGSTQKGVFAFAVDPMNSGTVYLGTLSQKVWKTQDCGSTWTAVATGRNGDAVNSGVNWTMMLDPTDSKILYTNSGYGKTTNGAFKSTNGGVDWDQVWPPPKQPELGNVVQYNFANVFAMDPSDHKHILLTFHAVCSAPYNETCLAESTDGGATWRVLNGDRSWVGTEGQVVYFLNDSKTWLWASSSNGYWRTENAGSSWTKISPDINEAHPQSSQIIRVKDGTFYLAASDGVFRSPDGKSWSKIDGTGPLAGGLVSDGTTIYMSNNYYFSYGTDLHPYFTATEDKGAPWKPMNSPGMSSGGSLGYDPGHHLLFSSNFQSGFYRVVVP